MFPLPLSRESIVSEGTNPPTQAYHDVVIYDGTDAADVLYEGPIVVHANGWLELEGDRLLSPSAVHTSTSTTTSNERVTPKPTIAAGEAERRTSTDRSPAADGDERGTDGDERRPTAAETGRTDSVRNTQNSSTRISSRSSSSAKASASVSIASNVS